MKIPALMTCLLAMLLAAMPLHHAKADEVNFDVFYNSLADDGDWYNTPEYGYVWQPFVAYKTDKWRPYSDGYWAQTDDGWTWVSYENFGWATYHYGRWTRLKDTGWVWVPGYDWGPGWVSWRTNDDYVGWAPLPPKVEEGVYEGRVVDSHRPQAEQIDYNDVEPEEAGYGTNVDVQYDIGPANYCFVETRNFGAPVLGEVLLPPQQNYVFIERTRNVTNIYYRRDRDRTVVYNNGPDFGFINSHVERPIPRLQLERRDDPGFLRDGLRGGGNPTLVRNGVLQVASPMIARRPVNFTQIKPTRIKQTLAQPQVARGWSNGGGDQAAFTRIREQYKQQAAAAPARPANPVIPPAAQERDRVDRAAGNTPPAPTGAQPFVSGGQPARQGGAPNAPLTEADRIARRDARQKEREQRANGQPATPAAPAAGAQPNADQDKEARRAARQTARANGQPVPEAATPNPATPTNAEQEKEARRAARQATRANGQPATPAAPAAANPPNADQEKEARRAARQADRANGQTSTPENAQPQPSNGRTDEERAARQAARQQQPPQAKPAAPQADPQADQEREARRAARQQERADQPATPQAQQDQEARRAARQQERAAQPERQAPPQNANPAREPRQEQPKQGGKPGQSPAP